MRFHFGPLDVNQFDEKSLANYVTPVKRTFPQEWSLWDRLQIRSRDLTNQFEVWRQCVPRLWRLLPLPAF
jgi:hypothetical protein